MKKILTLVSVTILVTSLSACKTQAIKINKLYQSQQCGNHPEGIMLLNSIADIDRIKGASFSATGVDDGNQLRADFSKQTVVSIGLGFKPNPGFSLTLLSGQASVSGQTLVLPIEQGQPQKDALYAQLMVSPCMILAFQKGSYSRLRAGDFELELK